MKIAIILGTRPEIIKFSPIVRECEHSDLDYFILHTGQHYSYNMDKVFFEQLALPEAKYNLDVGSGTHAEQTGKIMIGIEKILEEECADYVLVQGDTNSALAGGITATKLGIRVGHVEAGLRSYDKSMPEEVNRVIIDHCSDLLFAPTTGSAETLLREGLSKDKVFITGNTIVDAVYQNLKISREKTDLFRSLDLDKRGYFLSTIHRQENVDNTKRFKNILDGLTRLEEEFQLPVICPIHPRARKKIEALKIDVSNIRLLEPVDYLTFLRLESEARLVLTDSGGVQEEACILQVPCVTLRYNTERPETVQTKANMLAGSSPEEIILRTRIMLNKRAHWDNPFGDGRAGKRIVDIILSNARPNDTCNAEVWLPEILVSGEKT